MKKRLLSCIALLLSSVVTNASNVEFESIQLQGRGCSEETSSVVLSPDREKASILFDTMSVEVPFAGMDDFTSSFEKVIDRKVCNIKVKLNVPTDEIVTGVEFQNDFRGITVVDYGAETEFDSRIISWNDSQRRSRINSTIIDNQVFRGEVDRDLTISKNTIIDVDSSCGASRSGEVEFVLRSFIRAEVVNKYISPAPTALMVLDSNDMGGSLKIKLHTQKCHDSRPTRPSRPTRGDRSNRDKLETCKRMGGIWLDYENKCTTRRRR